MGLKYETPFYILPWDVTLGCELKPQFQSQGKCKRHNTRMKAQNFLMYYKLYNII